MKVWAMTDQPHKYFQVRESGALSVIQFRLAVTQPTTVTSDVHMEITDFVTRNECQKLVVDLSSMAYLPSSLIGILAMLSGRGVEIHLANASADVLKVMQVMGLTKRIHVNEFEITAPGKDDDDDDDKAE